MFLGPSPWAIASAYSIAPIAPNRLTSAPAPLCDQTTTVDFPCPNHRNKGLKPLVPHDQPTMESGFQAI
ncbi:hypothetical protein AMR42_18735 [Limnothrix sp. PR1529]|nr:hypothetical protein BCR12_17785 [Limnothrix sp. P13C2]PIB03574.1 hypothetical protein AMR42_18735 [Limnothrix sp. PR1529]